MSAEGKENRIETASLRAELKQWENAFREQHGRKAGRDDIKKDAAIDAKYRLYNKLSRPPNKQLPPRSPPRKSPRFHPPKPSSPSRTPSKPPPFQSWRTPIRTKQQQQQQPQQQHPPLAPADPPLSPVPEVDPTPAFIRNALGPTPQKDGQVLGIFDIMAEDTPLRGGTTDLAPLGDIIAGTPSKPAATITASTPTHHFKSPQDSSQRYFLDAFAGTPLKRKRAGEDEDDGGVGTGSASKRTFATPSFLRRSFPLARIREDEDDEEGDGAVARLSKAPFGKRGLVRSLSSIIQGLKRQEEERMDDDWDVMNEIEEEEDGGGERARGGGGGKEADEEGEEEAAVDSHEDDDDDDDDDNDENVQEQSNPPKTQRPPKILVQDSQAGRDLATEIEMPLGPDQAAAHSSDEDAPLDPRATTGRKPWKKKGLKRQTRRVAMRPVLHKAGKADAGEESDGAEAGDGAFETEAAGVRSVGKGKGTAKGKGKGKEKQKEEVEENSGGDGEEEETTSKKKKKRMIDPNAVSHANFRRLNIKNKNSKANGRGRKFGGRR